jgi:hypothetical protein
MFQDLYYCIQKKQVNDKVKKWTIRSKKHTHQDEKQKCVLSDKEVELSVPHREQ